MLNHNNMPGAGSVADTMEFMRKMWGGMGVPAMGIPSLSVEEINKKIADLKTVASWLELNMNMLRATIQTLEVQSATLSTLKAMGAVLTSSEDGATASAASASPFGFPAWPPQSKEAPHSAAAEPEPEDESEEEEEDTDDDEAAARAEAAQSAASAAQAVDPQAGPAPDLQAAMTNPNAWWNLLQEQFQQAVGNVLADQTPADKDATPAKAAAPKKTTKPKAEAKPGTRAKSGVVQSRQSKPASSKPKSP